VSINLSGGASEDGVVIGNTFDKYGSKNPIVKLMMKGFEKTLSDFVEKVEAKSIHEIGCGEGYWVLRWSQQGISARGCDFSKDVIEMARGNAQNWGIPKSLFQVQSIYDLDVHQDSADLIVCCEVLEHLEYPGVGLNALKNLATHSLILSVPREPLWRILNLSRAKYITQWGNTPGHIQHWSKTEFVELVSKYFEVVEVRSPLPWTMVLCRPYK
jgi:2-polyprenyl-3-methyl-5-hydroxy-6-metoxy-1,4-benzoquinol methylase